MKNIILFAWESFDFYHKKNVIMKLESIDEILNYLNPNQKDIKRSQTAMESAAIHLSELDEYLFWNEDHYTRNLIAKTEIYELFICCWEPNHFSELHDLDGQMGWIKVLQGNLEVKCIDKSAFIEEGDYSLHQIDEGDIYCHQSNQQVYSVMNKSGERAISLHLVSLPVSFHNVLSGKGTDVQQMAVNYFSINGRKIA